MSQIAIWRTLPVEPFGYWHHGVLCPDKTVIHFKSQSSLIGKRDARIVHTSFRKFMGFSTPKDTPVYRIIHRKQLPPDEVVRRARSCLGERGYNLFNNNCETFASWAVTGHKRSYQIESLRSALRHGYRNGNVAGAMCAVADVVADMPVPCPSMVPLKHRSVKSRRSKTSSKQHSQHHMHLKNSHPATSKFHSNSSSKLLAASFKGAPSSLKLGNSDSKMKSPSASKRLLSNHRRHA